jgi:hypothetical protein
MEIPVTRSDLTENKDPIVRHVGLTTKSDDLCVGEDKALPWVVLLIVVGLVGWGLYSVGFFKAIFRLG